MKKRLDTNNNWLYMTVSEEGIKLCCCEPTMVAMSSSSLDKKCINNLKIMKEKVLINNIDRYNKVITTIGNSKNVTLDITDSNIIIKTDTEIHTLCRMDEQTLEEFPIPNLEFDKGVSFNIKLDVLKRISNMGATFSEKTKPIIIFTIGKNSIRYEMNDNGESVEGSLVNITTPNDNEFTASFSLDYFNKILKCLSADIVKINLKEDYPLQIDETLGNFITTKFIAAPWVENEEQDDTTTEGDKDAPKDNNN